MRRWRTFALSVLIAGVLGGLAGCGQSNGQQAVNSLKQQLETPGSGVQMSGENAGVGTPDPTVAWVVGPPHTVTVQKADMIRLPGFRLPQLASVGVLPGGAGSDNSLEASTNPENQVQVLVNGHQLRLLSLTGYRIRMGNAKCAPAFVYTVIGNSPGDYAVAGLRLTVQFGGQTQTVIAYNGIFVRYYAPGESPSNSTYNNAWNAATSAQQQRYNSSH